MQSPKFFCKYCKKFISVLENEITKNHLQFLNKIPSSLLESYELEYNIGIGTLGIVYKAINTIDDKTFALKLISFLESDLTQEQINQNIQDFIKEIKILSNVKHENIFNYITSIKFSEDNMIALIMELAETNLSNIITNLTPLEMMDYVIQICIGLDYLHNEKHISHGNLKLENLLILNKKIKISDFCFAKVKHYEKERNRRIFEKQYYMAPELLNDIDFLDNKIDIWSLGIIIHKIFTGGVHPFGPTEITSNIRNGNYFIDKSIQNDKIIEIIQGCFKKNSNERIDIKKILEILIVETPKETFVNKNNLPKNPIESNSNSINPQGKSINLWRNLSNQFFLGIKEKEIKEKNSNTSKITPIFYTKDNFCESNKCSKKTVFYNEKLEESDKLYHFVDESEFKNCNNNLKKNNSSKKEEEKTENFNDIIEYSDIKCPICENRLKKSLKIMEDDPKLIQCYSEKCKGKIFCQLCTKEVLEKYIVDHIGKDCVEGKKGFIYIYFLIIIAI